MTLESDSLNFFWITCNRLIYISSGYIISG
jgi:hypothetical protein